MTATTAPMSLRLDRATRDKLNAIALRQKRTAHALATEAITALVNKKEHEHAFNQSCLQAYHHYQETGLHVTHDEVFTWLESIGSGQDLPAPTCHT